MHIWSIKIKTAFSLGLNNILNVVIYRLSLKVGLHKACRLEHSLPKGPYFNKVNLKPKNLETRNDWKLTGSLFGHIFFNLENDIPNWHKNLISNRNLNTPLKKWWKILDFDESVGDIKIIWDLSRMSWLLPFAQRARNGDEFSFKRINQWLSDWCINNPSFYGSNWKCGQEASIRVIHLACATLILNQEKSSREQLLELVYIHLKRIESTISYAIAQDNNHGTSEAAALFIGGSWLLANGYDYGEDFERKGRYYLEERAKRLIGEDGSFSQYSLNYHRLMLDTYSFAEVWRLKMDLPRFSDQLYERLVSATNWLYQIISPKSGHGPNIGANDGSIIIQLTNSEYKDFRPTVQLSMALFNEERAYLEEGLWNLQLQWLDIEGRHKASKVKDYFESSNGGFSFLNKGKARAVFRYPNFKFRPAQSDLLHLDLWIEEKNIFRDAGTYSYNSVPDLSKYFSGVQGHNTIQFDDRDQMIKLSRFLFGGWLKTIQYNPITEITDGLKNKAGYIDNWGSKHIREVSLTSSSCRVIDEVSGFRKKAILRWRLLPGNWEIEKVKNKIFLKNSNYIIDIESSSKIKRFQLVKGWQSDSYLHKKEIKVLEIEIQKKGTIISNLYW